MATRCPKNQFVREPAFLTWQFWIDSWAYLPFLKSFILLVKLRNQVDSGKMWIPCCMNSGIASICVRIGMSCVIALKGTVKGDEQFNLAFEDTAEELLRN